MKRDMDLIRKVLQAVEAKNDRFKLEALVIDGFDAKTIAGHVEVLVDAGYIEGTDLTTMGTGYKNIVPQRLTWDGHEFLEAIRNDTVWTAVKNKVQEEGGSAPLKLIGMLADAYLKKKLGLE